ncbi:MAG: uracil-DNA glycosylase [Bacilli bacterium]|nr:uracil-DNA glycosylase [Bacilli bacterium]MDD4733228.1 uracil-DNA glycosylase [Bacilli bacterium]
MINKKWDQVLMSEIKQEYFKKLKEFIDKEYKEKTIYPKYQDIFNAFKYTGYDQVKVVILGQDPYHGYKEAHGLSFSVQDGVKRPPSLNNIFKELKRDLGKERLSNDLTDWAKQGVLLLNSIMTVVKDSPASHKNKGWEIFTDNVIKYLNKREEPIVFILWGNYAKSKKALITNENHLILESVHPSPFSANNGFFGSKPFSKTNDFLRKNNEKEIEW